MRGRRGKEKKGRERQLSKGGKEQKGRGQRADCKDR
jgi:hypothetical protein